MSQYPPPPPYPPSQQQQQPQQPGYGYDFSYYQPQQQDPLAPARRASVLMFILGGLIVLPSFCCGAMGLALPGMMAQQPGLFSEMSAAGMTPEALQVTLVVVAGVALFIGVAMIVLGRFVRGGGIGPVVTSIVLVALIAIYLLLNGLGAVVLPNMTPPQKVLGCAMSVFGLAILGVLLLWLIQAAKAASRVATMKSQYQQQYWQYQQQQQMYQSGYVAPPPVPQQQQQPPPVPPTPTPPAGDDPSGGSDE